MNRVIKANGIIPVQDQITKLGYSRAVLPNRFFYANRIWFSEYIPIISEILSLTIDSTAHTIDNNSITIDQTQI